MTKGINMLITPLHAYRPFQVHDYDKTVCDIITTTWQAKWHRVRKMKDLCSVHVLSCFSNFWDHCLDHKMPPTCSYKLCKKIFVYPAAHNHFLLIMPQISCFYPCNILMPKSCLHTIYIHMNIYIYKKSLCDMHIDVCIYTPSEASKQKSFRN